MAKLSTLTLLAIVLFIGLWFLWLAPHSDHRMNNGEGLNGHQSGRENSTESGIFGRGLYTDNTAFNLGQKANPNYQITFPLDHGEHSAFDIEWWYLTANLQDQNKQSYGLQWTLFRFRNPNAKPNDSSWSNEHIYMAHASVHSMDKHWFAEKFARGGVGNAGVLSMHNHASNTPNKKIAPNTPFTLFIDDWRWQNNHSSNTNNSGLLPAELRFELPLIDVSVSSADANADKSGNTNSNAKGNSKGFANTENLSISLQLTQSGPFVKHGENGYSIKSGEQQHASHYYSAPFIDVQGTFTIQGQHSNAQALQVTGQAWFDQEWTSQLLDTQTAGWDWMSLHLDDGSRLMAFRMRLNGQDDYVTGSFINPQGQLRTLLPQDISLAPLSSARVNGKSLPLHWQLSIPSLNIDIQIASRKQNQWNPSLVSYYEGMVSVTGSQSGEGFLELTGY